MAQVLAVAAPMVQGGKDVTGVPRQGMGEHIAEGPLLNPQPRQAISEAPQQDLAHQQSEVVPVPHQQCHHEGQEGQRNGGGHGPYLGPGVEGGREGNPCPPFASHLCSPYQ